MLFSIDNSLLFTNELISSINSFFFFFGFLRNEMISLSASLTPFAHVRRILNFDLSDESFDMFVKILIKLP